MSLDPVRLTNLAQRAQDELLNNILPFWLALEDRDRGGHYGFVSFDGLVNTASPKAAVFTGRVLWFLTEIYRIFGHPEAATQAGRTKRFLLDHFEDKTDGGLFWSVSAEGAPLDTDKHLCGQGYGIFALAAYAKTFADDEAASAALRLFHVMCERALTDRGFTESFDRQWRETPNHRLAPGPKPARRTCGVHVHLVEALTPLVRLDLEPAPRDTVAMLLRLLLDHFLSADRTNTYSYLSEDLEPFPAAIPLGHDIKTGWLLDLGADAVGDAKLSAEVRAAASTLAGGAVAGGQMEDGSFVLERTLDGKLHPWRYWWVQAEGMAGLVNEAERGGVPGFLERAERLWNYIENKIKDPSGEWYSRVDPSGVPDRRAPKVEPWKEPYHQGRACMRLVERARLLALDTPKVVDQRRSTPLPGSPSCMQARTPSTSREGDGVLSHE